MSIEKTQDHDEAVRLARRHAAEALKEQTLYSDVWCTDESKYAYQSELYRLADECLRLNEYHNKDEHEE